ncbi:MAG: hypothetical protein GEU75_00395 [Dehalococcoidia bacterium]|nr:hypothetical protein [Dehalococcoidia bacterium]
MRRADWQPAFDRLLPFVEDAARTQYEAGKLDDAFRFWAVGQVLTDTGLSDNELLDAIRLDNKSDLGIDGYYEDADNETLFLFQSRFHSVPTPIGNDELSAFLASFWKILNPEIVLAAAARNPVVQDAHKAVRDAIEAGWTLAFVFVGSGYLSPEGAKYSEEFRSKVQTIDSMEIRQELAVYDIEGLLNLYESHLSPARLNTDVTLNLTPGAHFSSTVANFRVLMTNIPASEILNAFRQHQFALFKLNPRGPLQNKTNREIKATLADPQKRKYFFHLNNGITALCSSFSIQGDSVAIRDFQIVNGCQTTVTLWNSRAVVEGDNDVRVLLRLIEGLTGIGEEIAETTNTQARLKAQDFKSRDKLQADLKNQFDVLSAPIFYEIKRGDWEMEPNKQRYAESQTGVFRRIKMIDLAQATLAFLGEPGDAKDRSRSIFEVEARYKKVFPDGVRVEQLLLPWHVYLEAASQCALWNFNGAAYARYCLTGIVGVEFAPSHVLPSSQAARQLLSDPERIKGIVRRGQPSHL